MTTLYNNQDWMYAWLRDEPTGRHYLEVVCGSIGLYTVCLRLTEAEATSFQAALAAGDDTALTLLAKQVVYHAPRGIPGREYRPHSSGC